MSTPWKYQYFHLTIQSLIWQKGSKLESINFVRRIKFYPWGRGGLTYINVTDSQGYYLNLCLIKDEYYYFFQSCEFFVKGTLDRKSIILCSLLLRYRLLEYCCESEMLLFLMDNHLQKTLYSPIKHPEVQSHYTPWSTVPLYTLKYSPIIHPEVCRLFESKTLN